MSMGRTRKTRKDLPQRMYFKGKKYYFVDKANKWHSLGADYSSAIIEYTKINSENSPLKTVSAAMDRYIKEVLPKKAPRTQKDNLTEIGHLRKVFGKMRPADIEPTHIYTYMDKRPSVRANREKALLSHVLSYCIRWGMLDNNPCREVKRNPETPSGKYVHPEQYQVVYAVMPETMQCAMDLALLTGLRQADIRKLSLTNCKPDGLLVKTGKTGREILFEWTDDLTAAVERAKKLPSKITTMALIHNKHGQAYTESGFKTMWQRTIRTAVEKGLIDKSIRFAFKDLRTTAASDAKDDNLLGHTNRATLFRHYKRKPLKVTPLR